MMTRLFCLFLFLFSYQFSQSCTFESYSLGYSFINPELVKRAVEPAPFFLDIRFADLYENFEDEEERKESSNIQEWKERVCDYATEEEVRAVIYQSDLNDLLSMRSVLQDPKRGLSLRFKDNDFADYLLDLKCDETINYLIFAKRCEPFVTLPDDAWQDINRDLATMNELIEEGTKAFKRTNSHYIRLRYAYQVVRLAHYAQDYKLTLQLYDYFMPKTDERNSLIYHWIQGHYAGALRALGENVRASAIYASIFSDCPSRRESAFRSFLIRTDEEWEECYLLCKTAEERAAMYAIRAGRNKGRVLEEMKKIYSITPKNDFLELLLLQEIRRLEDAFLGYPKEGYALHQRVAHLVPKNEEAEYLIDLQDFVRACRQENLVKNKDFWHTAEGYLEFLAGDYYKARQTLHEVERYVQNEELSNQINILRTVIYLSTITKIGAEEEEEILALLEDEELLSRYPDFKQYYENRIANLYLQSGNDGLAFLAFYNFDDLKYNPDLDLIDDIETAVDNGEFERFINLLGRDTLTQSAILSLTDIRGTYYMARGQWLEASLAWSSIDRSDWRQFALSNPFRERFEECINCRSNMIVSDRDSTGLYTKGAIVEELLERERRARLGGYEGTDILYDMGVAIYNMSYFGIGWQATDFFRSGSSYTPWNLKASNGVVRHPIAPYGNKENFDLVNTAIIYFEQAYSFAMAQERFELAARSAFMIAKCQQKQYYMSDAYRPKGYNDIPMPTDEYMKGYAYLSELAFTDFYKERIRECKYFEAYMR
jgi:hypothetical protein